MPLLSVAKLIQELDMLNTCPWEGIGGDDLLILQTMVSEALANKDFETASHDELIAMGDVQSAPPADVFWHARRIATLICTGWHEPIQICVGTQQLKQTKLEDGNHRLWAAAMRGDFVIDTEVIGEAQSVAVFLERMSQLPRDDRNSKYPWAVESLQAEPTLEQHLVPKD